MMNHLNKAQIKSLIIIPSVTGCISSFASITLIVSIFQSNQKLSTVYRRLIFSLSVFDIIVSIPRILSSLPMPAGTVWGAIGNDTTCDLQGFLIHIGLSGSIFYSLSLTVYFLLVVKFDMTEAKIKKFVEPFLHVIPIMYSLSISAYLYATDNFNPAETLCRLAPEPLNCEDDPEVECLSTTESTKVILTLMGFGGIPLFGGFVGNCIILTVIWWAYRKQIRKNQAYGHLFAQSPNTIQAVQSDDEEQLEPVEKYCSFCTRTCLSIKNCFSSQNNVQRTSSVLANYLSQPSRTSVRRLKEISNHAAAYVAGYLLTYTFAIISAFANQFGSGPAPYIIILLARTFIPLQGLFNVLVYTFPHVISYQRNHPECSWFQAFWKVVRTGGDSDQSRIGRTSRRRSVRQRQRVIAQSEFRRRSGVEGIMTYTGD